MKTLTFSLFEWQRILYERNQESTIYFQNYELVVDGQLVVTEVSKLPFCDDIRQNVLPWKTIHAKVFFTDEKGLINSNVTIYRNTNYFPFNFDRKKTFKMFWITPAANVDATTVDFIDFETACRHYCLIESSAIAQTITLQIANSNCA